MNKVIGSRVDLNDDNNKYAVEFRTYIEDLFDNDTVQKLDRFTQHFHTSRLQHSLNVSYYSYRIAKVIGCDCRAAARAGLLHDLFWYDWKSKKLHRCTHFSIQDLLSKTQVRLQNFLQGKKMLF